MITAITFYFAPAAETSWSLSMERFSEAAVSGWPTSIITQEQFPDGRHYVDFWNDEPRRDALYEEDETLIYKNGTPQDTAQFVAWFLSLLPVDARIRFSSEAAVERGVGTVDWSLPRNADIRHVTGILESHVRDIYGEDAP